MNEMLVSGVNLKIMAEMTSLMGVPMPARAKVLMGHISMDEGSEGWFSSHVIDEIYQDLVMQTNRSDLGLQLACSPALARFGTHLPMLLLNAPTFAVALSDIAKFACLYQERSELEYDLSGPECVIRLRPNHATELGKVCRTDFVMLSLTHAMRFFGGGKSYLTRVHFAFAEPTLVMQYSSFFDAPMLFNQPDSELFFDSALLSCSMSGADPVMYSTVLKRANLALSAQHGRMSLAAKVWQVLAERLHMRPSMEEVAQALGYNSRTLRRHLAEADTNYQSLMQQMQMDRACDLLTRGERSIQQVSDDVGFVNASAFHRAFLRWTGQTPKAWQMGLTAKKVA